VGERGLKNGEVELKVRKTGERLNVKKEDLQTELNKIVKKLCVS